MNAGMSEYQFRELAATTARLGAAGNQEPIAVVRVEGGWRTLYADGSSHPGRPVSHEAMDELAVMVDQYRADAEELRRLALLWEAIEQEFAEESPETFRPKEDSEVTADDRDDRDARAAATREAVAAENRAAAWASERVIDVEALEDWVVEAAAPTPDAVETLALGEIREVPAAPASDGPSAAEAAGAEGAGHDSSWRTSTSFVPWSVVEAMVDVELDGFFRRRRAS